MNNFQNIYCVEKTTAFERVKEQKIQPTNLLAARRINNHKNHTQFMSFFLQKLQKNFNNFQLIKDKEMKNIQPNTKDLVISCGGDGTFLACAQDYLHTTLLGINTNYLPQDIIFGSLGALTSINKNNLEKRWKQLVEQNYTLKRWKRLTVKIDENYSHHYAVNDIFIGKKTAYKACYCSLESNKHFSEFFCSGILSCTGVGSHSWYRNAGGTPFGRSLDSFAYLVLNPNIKSPLPETSEIISGKESIKIKSLKDEIIVAFDSRDSIAVPVNKEIEILLDDKNPIKVVNF